MKKFADDRINGKTRGGDDEISRLINRLSRQADAVSGSADKIKTRLSRQADAVSGSADKIKIRVAGNAAAQYSYGYSESLQSRAARLREAAEQSRRYIDPRIKAAREKLPIFQKKAELMQALVKKQVLIVIGETGSGKTSQVPQYLNELGFGIKGRIGCTQLRRMAAKTVARRVAKEQGCNVGEEVGYTVRFDDKTGPKTKIQYMTDGILLRDCTKDPTLTSYSAVILDESHERTVETDILLGVLRLIIKQRNDLRLIISSATLDAKKFSKYFHNAEVFNISGRTHPVEIFYRSSQMNCVDAATEVVIDINEREERGDIIVFMSGEYEIDNMCEKLHTYKNCLRPELIVLPCYSALSWEEQAKIFELTPRGKRKVVIATNIAETSLTIDGIANVIDSGFVKQNMYDHKRGREVLETIRVSQAQAIQRAGRAGRLSAGKCYRLYSEEEFKKFVSGNEPEIKRSNLTSAVLTLTRMGFKDLSLFQFIDEPPAEAIKSAKDELLLYGAIDLNGEITEIGKKMVSFPLDPYLSKMLVVAEQLSCADEMLTIVALLSSPSIYVRPRKEATQADAAKMKFFTNEGDLLTMLNVYKEWKMYNQDGEWCRENFVHGRVLQEVESIRNQLYNTMNARNMTIRSAGEDHMRILKSICSGMIQNVAKRQTKGYGYNILHTNELVYIHRGSSLFHVAPEWVVFQKVAQTQRSFMREVTPINPEWLAEFTPPDSQNQ